MNSIRFAMSVAIASALCASAGYAQTPAASTPTKATSPSAAVNADSAQDKRMAAGKDDGWSSPTPADQKMKVCMARQSAKSPGMSKSDMTKACNDQMKMQKASVSEAPASTPQDRDVGTAPTPK